MKNPNWIIFHGTPENTHGTQFEEHWVRISKNKKSAVPKTEGALDETWAARRISVYTHR